MGSNRNNKRNKKPMNTTLGKGPNKSNSDINNEADISQLRKPIETSVAGIKQITSALENGTNEVKNLLMCECNIMYECRICRSIFRSLANFLLHKRNYCTKKFLPFDFMNHPTVITSSSVTTINPEECNNKNSDNLSLDQMVEKLHNIKTTRESAKELLTDDLSGERCIKNMDNCEIQQSNVNIILENIDSNSSGCFQTVIPENKAGYSSDDNSYSVEFMKSEVMELHRKIECEVPILDAEGKISGFTTNGQYPTSLFDKADIQCIECNQIFATQKYLANHIKSIHNPSRLVYVCPNCKDTFANPWCVYRHLIKVHRMTNKQVKRMRDQISNNFIRRDEEVPSTSKTLDAILKEQTNENQWSNDIEYDKDLQICAGCGKRFDRKAALHSHSQMCAKRLEMDNNNKKKEAAVENKTELALKPEKVILKGAARRKQKLIATTYQNQNNLLDNYNEENSSKEIELPSSAPHQLVVEPQLFEHNTYADLKNISTIPAQMKNNEYFNENSNNLPNIEVISLSSAENSMQSNANANNNNNDPIILRRANNNNHEEAKNNLILSKSELLRDDVSFEVFYSCVIDKDASNDNQEFTEKNTTNSAASAVVKDEFKCDFLYRNEETELDISGSSATEPVVKKAKIIESPRSSKSGQFNFISLARPYISRKHIKCLPCVKRFCSMNALLTHMSSHFAWYRYQCSRCSLVSFNKSDCLIHVRQFHKIKDKLAGQAVIRLPDWKIKLLSHDFRMIKVTAESDNDDEEIYLDKVKDENKTSSSYLPYSSSSWEDRNLNDDDGLLLINGNNNDECNIINNSERESLNSPSPPQLEMQLTVPYSDDLKNSPPLLTEVNVLQENGCLPLEEKSVKISPETRELTPPRMEKISTDDDNEIKLPLSINGRPVRMRTKPKLKDGFLYYDPNSSVSKTFGASRPRSSMKVTEKESDYFENENYFKMDKEVAVRGNIRKVSSKPSSVSSPQKKKK